MSEMKDFYRWFREEVRDSEEALSFYRKFRETRDDVINKASESAETMLEEFKKLPLEKQVELFQKLYELLFGKK